MLIVEGNGLARVWFHPFAENRKSGAQVRLHCALHFIGRRAPQ
jgi:hypothetical protein